MGVGEDGICEIVKELEEAAMDVENNDREMVGKGKEGGQVQSGKILGVSEEDEVARVEAWCCGFLGLIDVNNVCYDLKVLVTFHIHSALQILFFF